MSASTTFRAPDFSEYRALAQGGPYQRRRPTPEEVEQGRSLLELQPQTGDMSECHLEKVEILGRQWGVFTGSDGRSMAVRWIAPLDGFLDQALDVTVKGVMVSVRKKKHLSSPRLDGGPAFAEQPSRNTKRRAMNTEPVAH